MMRITNNITICLIFISGVILLPDTSFATGKFSNPKGTAMAGAYIGLARGIDAPVWNPANLGLSTKNLRSINLINLGFGLYNNSFTINQYNSYNGDSLTTEDIDDILNSVPDNGLNLFINAESQLLSFASGLVAFSIEGLINSNFQLDKKFLEVILRGNEMDRIYHFDNSHGEAYAVLSYNLSGALPLEISQVKKFAIGRSLKFLQGFRYIKIIDTQGLMTTTTDGLEAHGNINFKSADGGNGIGFDIGVASEIDEKWTVSMVLKNIFSQINWAKSASEKSYSFLMDPITLDVFNDTDLDSIFKTDENEKSVAAISSSLPTEFHLGALYCYNNLSFTLDCVQSLKKKPGYSNTPQVAAGMQYHVLPWLQLRTGIAVGGNERLKSAGGFGVNFIPVMLDFGISNCGGMFLRNQRGLNLAFGIGLWL